ncbi:MAG: hypothetical protein J5700_04315 [Treponema sp.]|nr:hypothetical protein [Treponema sp.]
MDAKTEIEGRKTFFIAPDVTFLPESYLGEFLARGYEAYIIRDFRFYPIYEQVRIIVETCPDSILFFFIDADVGVDWAKFIKYIQTEFEGKVLIGVLYAKGRSAEQKTVLEKYYLFDLGLQCGCIELEFNKEKNFAIIDKVMYANQACGRRKNVRAICDSSSSANFIFQGVVVKGRVSDISVSHFSFIPDPNYTFPDIPLYTKIDEVTVTFKGFRFKVPASLMIQRELEGGKTLQVFVMLKSNGQQGLDEDIAEKVRERIYITVTDKVKEVLLEKCKAWKQEHPTAQ